MCGVRQRSLNDRVYAKSPLIAFRVGPHLQHDHAVRAEGTCSAVQSESSDQ